MAFDLDRFIHECRLALDQPDPAGAVSRMLSEALRDPQAMAAALPAATLDGSGAARYDFLHQDSRLSVLHVVMPAGLVSPPHNHLVWAVIGMYRGGEDSEFFVRDGTRLRPAGHRALRAPEVMRLEAEVIHGISNPLAEPSRALHVYGGALANPSRSLWAPDTLVEEPFQVERMLACEREHARRARGPVA